MGSAVNFRGTRMIRSFFWALTSIFLFVQGAVAQATEPEMFWVQIEAHPNLSVAQERARRYDAELPDVNGFSLGGNWYGITLGPYERNDAEQVLNVYRNETKIPRDSYITSSRTYGRQFWPIGASALNAAPAPAPQSAVAIAPAPQIAPADETRAEARQSERGLLPEERKDLQRALQWSGFYSSGIDGAFGPGTRRSMSDWQRANGYEVTGVLTTLQRAALMEEYNAPLTSVGLARRVDMDAGIAMNLPLSAVSFSRYHSPFAHYDSATDDGVRVLLISQPGDEANLFGLFDILQTLEIVPLDGPRQREKDSFTLEGRNARIVTHAEASLEDGEIKGFLLVWPTGDERRRSRVLASMRQSFTRLPGVLDPLSGAQEEDRVDLLSGLEIRQPSASGSGFYIDATGTVVTTERMVRSCQRITLDNDYEAELLTSDAGLGVSILRPKTSLAPIKVAMLAQRQPRLQSEIAVAGYPYDGLLGGPSLTFGTMTDAKGLLGETELSRLSMSTRPGDVGGPIFDASGHVVGMLLPERSGSRQLPADVRFAAKAEAIQNVLALAGLQTDPVHSTTTIDPVDLTNLAADVTVLVQCWE